MTSPGRRARARLGELLIPARNTRQAGAYRMPPPQPGPRHTHRPPNPLPFAGPETPERKSPQPRVALDERSPAAALARGQARNRPRRNALLRRFRLSRVVSNSNGHISVRLRDHPEVVVVDSRRAAGRAAAREANRMRMFGRSTDLPDDEENDFIEMMNLRPRVLSEGDLRIHSSIINNHDAFRHHPEPDSRRRASMAAAEVRAARANYAAREEASARARATADAIASVRAREVAVYERSRRAALFGCSHEQLVARESSLLRRASATGSAGSEVARRLGNLRSERIAVEHVWANELDKLAQELDELPVCEASCVICLSKIVGGEVATRLQCQHVFHADCISDYFYSVERVLCPLCRHPIAESDLSCKNKEVMQL